MKNVFQSGVALPVSTGFLQNDDVQWVDGERNNPQNLLGILGIVVNVCVQ